MANGDAWGFGWLIPAHTNCIIRHRLLLLLVTVVVIVAAGCEWPNVFPPGEAPERSRDPIYNGVTVKKNLT